jgi:hypothetical protein
MSHDSDMKLKRDVPDLRQYSVCWVLVDAGYVHSGQAGIVHFC